VAQNRDNWRPVVKTMMNLQVPFKTENFLTDCWLLKEGSAPWSVRDANVTSDTFFPFEMLYAGFA
jgi:hypothetical protein